MRVLFWKLYCPSICFSKPSLNLQSPCHLNLEDALSSSPSVSHVLEEKSFEKKIDEAEKIEVNDVRVEDFPKSSLKKLPASGSKEVAKGKVKWMDFVGKELVEIREFEAIVLQGEILEYNLVVYSHVSISIIT